MCADVFRVITCASIFRVIVCARGGVGDTIVEGDVRAIASVVDRNVASVVISILIFVFWLKSALGS